jgi:hypothetical protein
LRRNILATEELSSEAVEAMSVSTDMPRTEEMDISLNAIRKYSWRVIQLNQIAAQSFDIQKLFKQMSRLLLE